MSEIGIDIIIVAAVIYIIRSIWALGGFLRGVIQSFINGWRKGWRMPR